MANETVKTSRYSCRYSNSQLWPWATGAPVDWSKRAPTPATIAVVDSGIDAVPHGLRRSCPRPGQHGEPRRRTRRATATATARSSRASRPARPRLRRCRRRRRTLLSIDVMNDQGQATVGDVVKAADWILANKTKYNIKVANFSLHAVNRASVMFDPLDQAVEKLWLNGIMVVAAAGNYGIGRPAERCSVRAGQRPVRDHGRRSRHRHELRRKRRHRRAVLGLGIHPDGFAKPDIAAPGRYMIGPVPGSSTLPSPAGRPRHGARLHAAERDVLCGAGRRGGCGDADGSASDVDARTR